ncbi:MAG: hypothetical protein IIT98_00220 [Kiritimatiellae bacterium]|nr:hypothetical protein [Kiritimatiellia bacterium]
MPRTVAIGFFDGVHAGHRLVLDGADAAVTFINHPDEILLRRPPPKLLMTPESRVSMLRSLVRDVVALDFSPELAAMSPAGFVSRYLRGVHTVRCGADWRFGRAGAGDAAFLSSCGFAVESLAFAETPDGSRISSTRIRAAVASGDFAAAAAMLGRPWILEGCATDGKRLGRELGFPTVNIAPDPRLVVPPVGVYEVSVRGIAAVANFGFAPTMRDKAWTKPVLELNFEDGASAFAAFGADPRGAPVGVEFKRRIRDERVFNSAASLALQIEADRAAVFGGARAPSA